MPEQGKEPGSSVPLQPRGSSTSQRASFHPMGPLSGRCTVAGLQRPLQVSSLEVTECQGCSGSLPSDPNKKKPKAWGRSVVCLKSPRLNEKLDLWNLNPVLFPQSNHLKLQGWAGSKARGFEEPLSHVLAGVNSALKQQLQLCSQGGRPARVLCTYNHMVICRAELQRPLSTFFFFF